ncbi:MAG: glycosyltransferase [Elusimicrobiota bacterium]
MPQISVVMTVYNGMPFLKESVQSILKQTFQDFEFIIVDNLSTDGSVEYLESIQDKRVRLFKNKENMGQTKALNFGILQATAPYVARMDADDISLPYRFEKQIQCMETAPEVGVLGGWHEEIDENGRHLKTVRFPTDSHYLRACALSDGNLTPYILSHPTVIMRKDVLLKTGLYNEHIQVSQDFDLWFRFLRISQIKNLSLVVLKYRKNSNSVSHRKSDLMKDEVSTTVRKNILMLMPHFSDQDIALSLKFVQNRSLTSKDFLKANDLLKKIISDHFLGFSDERIKNKMFQKVKFLYIPRLLVSHPITALLEFVKSIFLYPQFIFCLKFYKNIAKVCLGR